MNPAAADITNGEVLEEEQPARDEFGEDEVAPKNRICFFTRMERNGNWLIVVGLWFKEM